MLNYRKIEKIAEQLQQSLGIENEPVKSETDELNEEIDSLQGKINEQSETDELNEEIDSLQNQIDERTEEEQEEQIDTLPEPSVEASSQRVASLKRLIKLAKAVKSSTKLSAEQKKEALETIEKASKEGAFDTINRGKLRSKPLTTNDLRDMKQTNRLNTLINKYKNETLNKLIADEPDAIHIDSSLLGKTLGRLTISEILKLGPLLSGQIDGIEDNQEEFDEDINFDDNEEMF